MKKVLLSSLFTVFILSSSIFAQLDPTFAGGGMAYFSVGTGRATSLAVQPDNKILLMGTCTTTADWPTTFCVIRVNENGTRDNSFTERFIRPPGADITSSSGSAAVALQSDGKILMSGYATFAGSQKVVLVRLNTDGSTDNTFGTDGFVVTDVNSSANDYGGRIAIQPDGKIVIAGSSVSSSTSYQGFVARYLPDGTLDNSFAKGGIFTTNIPGASNLGTIVIQPDGKIIASGGMQDSSAYYFLTRLNPDGTLDTTWDGDGYKSVLIDPSPSYPYAGFGSIGISLDGKVAALGIRNDIYRFNADGSADTSFDGDGVRTSWYDGNQISYGLTVSASGRITAVGHRWVFNSPHGSDTILSISKFLPDGSPDTKFSDDGYFFGGFGNDGGFAAALDPQGRTVVAGLKSLMPSAWAIPTYFYAVRFTAPAVHNVAISGRATQPDGTPIRNITIALQHNGTTIATARTNPFGYFNFPSVLSGQNYSVSVKSRGLKFPAYLFFLDDEIANFNLVGEPVNLLSGRAEK